MNKNKLFFLLFLLVTVNVSGQSISNSFRDTVKLKLDKKKKVLSVEQNDFTKKRYKFKLNQNPDSTWAIAGDMDSLIKIVNRFSGNDTIGKIQLIKKLQDTASSEIIVFKLESVNITDTINHPKDGDKDLRIAELNAQLAEKEKNLKYLSWNIADFSM